MASSNGSDSAEPASSSALLLESAEKLFNLGCAAIRSDSYDEAVDCLSKALDIRVQRYGELGPECTKTYYKLGCALLYKVQAESDAIVDSKAGKGEQRESSLAEGSKLPDDNEESDDDEDERNEGEGMAPDEDTGEEEESDLELAWKLLDIARVIYAKEPQRTLAEVDVITALADVSLERELFQLCFEDYHSALGALENLVEADNRRIAELCFKISLAKQLDQKPQEALDFCRRAISVCEHRVERLTRGLATEKVPNGKSNLVAVEGVEKILSGKQVVESNGDGGVVALANGSNLPLEAKGKEEVAGVGNTNGSKNVDESTSVDGDVAQMQVSDLPSEAAVTEEVKEIEDLLVDLREKVEELQQMAVAPTLLEALKSANPEAAALMTEVYSRTMGVNKFENGGSNNIQAGSSSTVPVTNLGVMGRGVKRATPIPVIDEQVCPDVQPKKRTSEDLLKGGSSGETQIGFNGHS